MDELLRASIYDLDQRHKEKLLLPRLNHLTDLHIARCNLYKNLTEFQGVKLNAISYEDFLPLSVRLFKQLRLSSVLPEDEFKIMTSSGTTGQSVSKIVLDRNAAKIQSKVLVNIMREWLGPKRLPMLIIDHIGLTRNRSGYSARGAGVQGLSFLGYDHCYALNEDMQINWSEVDTFFEKYKSGPVLIFGFTFMIWKFFLKQLKKTNRTFPFDSGFLIHSGGWKKLQDEAVSPEEFSSVTTSVLGRLKLHNFYGMVEQTGTIFVECEKGHLHAPIYADVMFRKPECLTPCVMGEKGLIQVFSSLPTSYPGHVLLTEDLGRLLGEDDCDCGRRGRYFEVLGRMPRVEVRGCSDTFQ
ncbi:acyl-protein synthetase [Shewanella waksmanii]|uniref:LuxE/PaaK family acyltransferase n=1 Tax=Shewanella waksmanii TaxID=213783 RepID=UPI003735F8FF